MYGVLKFVSVVPTLFAGSEYIGENELFEEFVRRKPNCSRACKGAEYFLSCFAISYSVKICGVCMWMLCRHILSVWSRSARALCHGDELFEELDDESQIVARMPNLVNFQFSMLATVSFMLCCSYFFVLCSGDNGSVVYFLWLYLRGCISKLAGPFRYICPESWSMWVLRRHFICWFGVDRQELCVTEINYSRSCMKRGKLQSCL